MYSSGIPYEKELERRVVFRPIVKHSWGVTRRFVLQSGNVCAL